MMCKRSTRKSHNGMEASINSSLQPTTGVNMPLAKDLLFPRMEEERRKCKLKRLVKCPNSYFMDVKCPVCRKITVVFSHAQSAVKCPRCSTILCRSTGGKATLTDGCSFRRKSQ